MKIQANQIRPGTGLEHGGRQVSVIKNQLIQPAKGGRFIPAEMRDHKTLVKSHRSRATQVAVARPPR